MLIDICMKFRDRDGVMVMCNGNALQCITIFKVMGTNV